MLILIFSILFSWFISENVQIIKDDGFENYFEYYKIDGTLESTEQYHGCTIFISFWSKNCGPCIRSFSNDRALRSRLMEEGVIMINASIDNKDEWLRSLEKYNPNGLNIHPKKIQKLQRHFDIYFLPVYATIDIDGSIVVYPDSQKGNVKQFAEWFDKNG